MSPDNPSSKTGFSSPAQSAWIKLGLAVSSYIGITDRIAQFSCVPVSYPGVCCNEVTGLGEYNTCSFDLYYSNGWILVNVDFRTANPESASG